jgi:UDP-galactopyranose mutase
MIPFINRVKAIYKGEVFSFPVNLHTINQFFRKSFDPKSAKSYIESLSEKSIREPRNFEELALKTMGKDLYMAFFYHYTKKQWGCEPSDLPASILQRLPVRFDYNDNYYDKRFQGIPEEGYTPIFEKMLAQPAIKVQLNTKFNNEFIVDEFDHVFYSGRIDAFFNYEYGRLCYRTVFFEKGIEDGDFQGNAVINYTDDSVPFTRIHEHKHFTPWMNYQKTIFFKEFSKETCEKDIPFYPKRLSADLEKLNLYQDKVKKLKKFTFFGRLGSYCYMDMQHVINDAIKIANKF